MKQKELKADRDTIEILLVVTERCNLTCRYCYEFNKTGKRMNFETAKRIIDHELEAVEGTEQKVVIQFFGGECMLEFDLIKEIYDYVKGLNIPNFDCFFAVTNGTMLTSEMKNWLDKHKEDFICGLSLDGTKEVHDYNRSNSYDLIDFDFFINTWPKQKVKMTISPDKGLDQLSKCVIHCHELGFGVLCNLADGVEWEKSSSKILKRELETLVEYYLNHLDMEVCSILQMPLLHVALEERDVFPKWCGIGDHIHAYDVEGNLRSCQLFMQMSGNDCQMPEIKKVYSAERLPVKCRNCVLMGCCPTCMGTNVIRKCDLFFHTETECNNIKIQFLATSFLMYEKYRRGLLDLNEKEEYILLNGIKKIQESFSDL